MQQKLAELLFYSSSKPEEKWEGLSPETQAKFLALSKKSLEAIDKMGMTLISKADKQDAEIASSKRQEKIEKLLCAEIANVTFFKATFPKVSKDYWKELSKKINDL